MVASCFGGWNSSIWNHLHRTLLHPFKHLARKLLRMWMFDCSSSSWVLKHVGCPVGELLGASVPVLAVLVALYFFQQVVVLVALYLFLAVFMMPCSWFCPNL
ncbi:hypothetical protein U1Q18_016604 [Sarracenia purpurea var. burkii]